MYRPEFLRPGMMNNDWNAQMDMSGSLSRLPSVAETFLPLPSTPAGHLKTPIYESNNVGPGYDAGIKEFRRLQTDALQHHQDRIDEGSVLIHTHRQPDSTYQLGSLHLAQQETGFKWTPPPDPMSSILGIKPPWEQPKPITFTSYVPEPPKIDLSEYLPKPDFSELFKPKIDLTSILVEQSRQQEIRYRETQQMIQRKIELAPIVHQTPTETVFAGYGQSHFSYVHDPDPYTGGFHVSTQIPGIGEEEGLPGGYTHHDSVEEFVSGVTEFVEGISSLAEGIASVFNKLFGT